MDVDTKKYRLELIRVVTIFGKRIPRCSYVQRNSLTLYPTRRSVLMLLLPLFIEPSILCVERQMYTRRGRTYTYILLHMHSHVQQHNRKHILAHILKVVMTATTTTTLAAVAAACAYAPYRIIPRALGSIRCKDCKMRVLRVPQLVCVWKRNKGHGCSWQSIHRP